MNRVKLNELDPTLFTQLELEYLCRAQTRIQFFLKKIIYNN